MYGMWNLTWKKVLRACWKKQWWGEASSSLYFPSKALQMIMKFQVKRALTLWNERLVIKKKKKKERCLMFHLFSSLISLGLFSIILHQSLPIVVLCDFLRFPDRRWACWDWVHLFARHLVSHCCCLIAKSCPTLLWPCGLEVLDSSVHGFSRWDYWSGLEFTILTEQSSELSQRLSLGYNPPG